MPILFSCALLPYFIVCIYFCVDLCSGQAAAGPWIIRQADHVCFVFEAASAHILSHFFPSRRVLHKETTKSLLVLSRESPLRNLSQETIKHGSSTGRGGLSQVMSFGMGKVNFSTTLRGLVPAPQPGHHGLQISAQPGLGCEVPHPFPGGQKSGLPSLAEIHQASGPGPAFGGCWASFIGGSSSKSRGSVWAYTAWTPSVWFGSRWRAVRGALLGQSDPATAPRAPLQESQPGLFPDSCSREKDARKCFMASAAPGEVQSLIGLKRAEESEIRSA